MKDQTSELKNELTPEQKLYIESMKTWFGIMDLMILDTDRAIGQCIWKIDHQKTLLDLEKSARVNANERLESGRKQLADYCEVNQIDINTI